MSFSSEGTGMQSMKSRDTWSNRQIWPWSIQNEARPRLTAFCQENTLIIAHNTREDSMHRRHQMVNTEIRLIQFFSAKDGEALYSQQKQDWE